MEDVFRFRFNVYCIEKNYLEADDYPLCMEADEFDVGSTHFVVYGNRPEPVGYMRSVPADTTAGFPVFQHGLSVDHPDRLPPAAEAVECSRLMVRRDFRSRDFEDTFPHYEALPNPPAAIGSTLIQMKLVRLAYREALENGVRWFYAALEPPLSRLLNKIGFPLREIGPEGDYFGSVRPYIMDLREMERGLRLRAPQVWNFFNNRSPDHDAVIVREGEWCMPFGLQINHMEGKSYDPVQLQSVRYPQ